MNPEEKPRRKSKQKIVKMVRMSGMPVELENRDAYKSEWTRLFDIAQKVCKLDMLRMQKKMATIERILNKRFATVAEKPLPVTVDQWRELHDHYGPVMVRLGAQTNEVILVIYDVEDPMFG